MLMFIALLPVDVKDWRCKGHQVSAALRTYTYKAGSYLGLFPGLVGQQHREGFGGLRAPHPKSFPGVCSCFGTHQQFGRLKFLPRVNFLFGKSCTFHLSVPGFFTPWIKHGINDELLCRAASNQLSIKLRALVNPAVSWPQVTCHTGSLMVHPGFWVS